MVKETVSSLKVKLKALGLKSTGNKAELLERLSNSKVTDETSTLNIAVNSVANALSGVANNSNVGTVTGLKAKLNDLGAKTTGNKAVLKERLGHWTHYNLSRTLFEVNVSPVDESETFTIVEYEPLEKLDFRMLEWMSSSLIYSYFLNEMAVKGHDKRKKLFICEFIKNPAYFFRDNHIFLRCKCSAETKTSVDYEINIHLDNTERHVVKTECKCPAGSGPRAACKHLGAFFFTLEHYGISGKVKQNETCTGSLQQWHKPSSSGRRLVRATVEEMLKIDPLKIEPSQEVSKFYVDAFSRGID